MGNRLFKIMNMTPQEIQQQLNGIKDNKVSSFTDRSLDATRQLYKPVYQYDLDGNFIKSFESISHASKEVKIGTPSIQQALNGKSIQSNGFLWSYEKVDKIQPRKSHYNSSQKVELYDLEGNLVDKFSSVNQLGYWLYPNSPRCRRKLKDLQSKVRNKYVIKIV